MTRRRHRALRQYPYEWLAAIGMFEHGAQIARCRPGGEPDIDRLEDAAVHRHKMRGETDDDAAPRRPGETRFDLRRMAVAGDAIGVDAFGDLAIKAGLACGAAGAADPGFGVDDDFVGVDQPGAEQRR